MASKPDHASIPADAFAAPASSQALTTRRALQLAAQLHAAGQLQQAEILLRQILQTQPEQASALHLMGVIAHQAGNTELAVQLIGKAIQHTPSNPNFHSHLGEMCRILGRLDEAVAHGEKAVTLAPNSAAVHSNLGIAYYDRRELGKAEACQRRALAIDPKLIPALNNLGSIQRERKYLEGAIRFYRKALDIDPRHLESINNLGGVLTEAGQPEQAFKVLMQAIKLNPDYAEAHCNIAFAFLALGQLDKATIGFKRALALRPGYPDAHQGVAILHQKQKNLAETGSATDNAQAHKADARNNFRMGNTLMAQGKLDAAAKCYNRALSLKPDFAEAHNNLGNIFQRQGKLDAAVESYHQALSITPDFFLAHSNLLYVLSFHSNCPPAQYLAEARHYGSRVMAQARPYTHWLVDAADSAIKPLRVGLVSGDLKYHSVSFFLESILGHLNPDQIELVAYPTVLDEDILTARIKPCFAAWNPIAGLSDEAAARKIHADGIHILIDLAGHTAQNRLPVFAWRPAPVQVSWLGYFASTGVPGMDFLLADEVSVPPLGLEHFTETVWYLPDTRLCFTPPKTGSNLVPAPLPALRNGYITFGSFQNVFKLNDAVLALWGRIFHSLPQARLRLQNRQMNSPALRAHLQQRLALVGIAQQRLDIEGDMPMEDYLAAHADIDIILDTFPYPGGTTTCEALWMGVPTLTLAGNTLLARQGASLLNAAGLGDWIASNEDDYLARALAHASDINRLAQLRSGLRQKILTSPLFDAPRFALRLEDALQGMWQQKQGSMPDIGNDNYNKATQPKIF